MFLRVPVMCVCVCACGRNVLCSALRPQELKDKIVTAKDVIYLEDSETTINGIRFWESPWQPEFGGWVLNLPRGEECLQK